MVVHRLPFHKWIKVCLPINALNANMVSISALRPIFTPSAQVSNFSFFRFRYHPALAFNICLCIIMKKLNHFHIYVVPPQSWGDRSDTKHSKCLLLGVRRLNQLTLIPKPKGSGGAWAATAQVGPANKRNDTKRCLPIEASLRPGEAVPW